jgi:hypothetical protein
MQIAEGGVVNVAAAQPGWTVTVTWESSENDPQTCPVAAWATVVVAHRKDGTTTTDVEPVFNLDGALFTRSDLREHGSEGFTFQVNAPQA